MSLFRKVAVLIVAAAAVAGCCCNCAKETVAKSPDGRNRIKLFTNPLSHEVTRDGVTMVKRSAIAMQLEGETLSGSGRVAKVSCGSYAGEEVSPVYKKSKISLKGNWVFADYGDWGVRLIARDDGVAYRFETKKDGKIKVLGETAALVLPDPDAKCWVNFTNRFGCEETVPQSLAAKDVKTDGNKKKMVYLPFVCNVSGKTLAVTESDVCDYPIWNFTRRAGEEAAFDALFSPWPKKVAHVSNVKGWDKKEEIEKGGRWVRVKESADYLVECEGTRVFPWRTFILGDEPSRLCQADIVQALARPAAKDYDFSWVKPGKVAWDWWSAFDNKGDPKGCTTETYIRFIDFAAKTGVEYIIFDEGWSEKLNVWKYSPVVDVPYLVDYANKKGVGIILWMAWAQAAGDEKRVVEHFARLGVKGFKVDFMDRGDAGCERFLWTFAEECRKAKMIVDYHGAHRPTGMSRAYPNVVNYEGVHGLEQTKWFKNNYDFMANDVRQFFLRMTAGPMDYTPGAMDNYPIGKYKGTTSNPGSVGTRCRQMAMMAMYEAPLQMLCDAPTKYEKNMECFSFMAATPVVWADTVGLGGCPDSFAAVARKSHDGAWYAAAITDANAREITVDTAKFLGAGEWKAEIFRDAPDCDVEPVKYLHETKTVKAGEKLVFKTAPGGGFVVRFVLTGEVRKTLEKYVDAGRVAGVISVLSDGNYNEVFDCVGWADMENKVPMTPDTLFAIFSMTKTFTGAAIMCAIDEGKMSLDDEVSKYLPEFASVAMEDGSKPKRALTIRDLMSHVTGFTYGCGVVDRNIPLREVARRLAASKLKKQPGESFSYGNSWICSAAACLEIAVGMPFEKYLKVKILDPLGMKDTTFHPDAGQIRRMVKAYTTDDKALRPASDGCSAQLVFPKKKTIYPAAAGGLFSTARDMVRFSQMLAHHGEWKGRRIISRKTFDSVFAVKQTPKNIPNSYTVGSWLYGDWFGHEGAMRTDQRANLKTGHSRVFFIQTENKAGKAFFELKNDWHKACDKVQGTAPTVFKN